VKYFSSLVQKLFFKGLHGSPRKSWLARADNLGKLKHIDLFRNGGRIKSLLISPGDDEYKNSGEVNSVVIFAHPISRKAKYFFTETERAQAYLKRGHSVLLFDYNGFGESDRIDLFYWRDVVAAIDYVKGEFPQRRIILHGVSFGAFHIFRSVERLPLHSKVIVENVNKSLLSYWKRWPLTYISVIVLLFIRVRSVLEMDVQEVVKNLRRDDLDIRFLACERDEMSTLTEMRELYELLASAHKQFFVFLGAGHLAAPNSDPKMYALALFGEG
jgi:alpha/beta superfamily hydrolase